MAWRIVFDLRFRACDFLFGFAGHGILIGQHKANRMRKRHIAGEFQRAAVGRGTALLHFKCRID